MICSRDWIEPFPVASTGSTSSAQRASAPSAQGEAISTSSRSVSGVLGPPRTGAGLGSALGSLGLGAGEPAAARYALDSFDARWHPVISDALGFWRGEPAPQPYRRHPARATATPADSSTLSSRLLTGYERPGIDNQTVPTGDQRFRIGPRAHLTRQPLLHELGQLGDPCFR
jgi:hypothetical protein